MNTNLKMLFYVVLTVGACLFGYYAASSYKKLMTTVEETAGTAVGEAPAAETAGAKGSFTGYSAVMTYGLFFFFCILALGLLLGHDVSQYFGNRAVKALYNEEGEGMQDAEYDHAEQVWADGQHLEAIRLMREYLQKNPREQHVAVRIAEIYEKDLGNPLAAALEYDELLKHNLPRERWGWAAIHLCNLYFKLEKTDQAIALLRRIDSEYSETQAAEKARKRLAMFEGGEAQATSESTLAEEAPAPPSPPAPGALPPGFRSKRG